VQGLISASVGQPNKTAVVLADLDSVGDTHILVINNGRLMAINGLPDTTGVLSPTLSEYDMADGAMLGGFIKWARLTYPAERATFSFIGHGAALFPETAIGNVFSNAVAVQARARAVALPSHLGVHPDYTDANPAGVLSTNDLAEALRAGTQEGQSPLDVVDVVHCFAASIEELYPLRAFARATTASPNYAYFDPLMPGALLRALQFGATASDLAGAIVHVYDAVLPPDEHPRILVAVDNSRLEAVKVAWDALSQQLLDEPAGMRPGIVAAYKASSKYDTTLCAPQDWQLAPPDALADMTEFAAALAVSSTLELHRRAISATLALNQAVIATVSRDGSPWFAQTDPAPSWTFTGKGISIYADFMGRENNGVRDLSYQSTWYTYTVSAMNQQPYEFIRPPAQGGATWADVFAWFWDGITTHPVACLPTVPPVHQTVGDLSVARILLPLTRTAIVSKPLPIGVVIRTNQVAINPMVQFAVYEGDAVVYSDTIGAHYLITGEHLVQASRPWIPTAGGVYTIEVAVDPYNLVQESNENNNAQVVRIVALDGPIFARPVITGHVFGDAQWLTGPTVTLEIFPQAIVGAPPIDALKIVAYQFVADATRPALAPVKVAEQTITSPTLPAVPYTLPADLKPGPVVLHVWALSSAGSSLRPAAIWFNYTPQDRPIDEDEAQYFVFMGAAGTTYQIDLAVPDGTDANLFVWYPYNHETPDAAGISDGSDTVVIDAPVSGMYFVAVRGETIGGTLYALNLTPNVMPLNASGAAGAAKAFATPARAANNSAAEETTIPDSRPSVQSPIPELPQESVVRAFLPVLVR
jgi:hypothetical protein